LKPKLSFELNQKLKNIRLLALDSDGVLTDGGVYVADDGYSFRRFDIKDGAGLKIVMGLGIKVVVISSGKNLAVQHRCNQLGIDEVFTGVEHKLVCLYQVCDRYSIDLKQVCYMGDDLVDLPVLAVVGVSCAPADAVEEMKDRVSFVTSNSGGQGAVREVCGYLSNSHMVESTVF
jgi:3-deoxy-D-manno-octulosonate 8-phosphate phosphatase (KDO 8-P phosphatase)